MGVILQYNRRWDNQDILFLLGPGGVGKSSTGRLLAPLLGRTLLDLDLVFCEQLGLIGPYIAEHGYETYRAANLDLAKRLVHQPHDGVVFVTSSGFLAAPPDSEDRLRARALLDLGYVVTLLPSDDLEEACRIVVARQLRRPFGLVRQSEEVKFRARFPVCRDAADMLVVSQDEPERIAGAMAEALAR